MMNRLPEIIELPPAVDVHVHDREPSPINTSETFANGSKARAYDGYCLSADMPNTQGHETWSYERVVEKRERILKTSHIPMGVWLGSQPDHDNIGEFKKTAPLVVGKKAYTHATTGNDKEWTAEDFRESDEEFHAQAPDKPHAIHAGPDNLEGFIESAEKIGFHLHVCHVDDPRDVLLIAEARKREVNISCGITPRTLFLTDLDEVTRGQFAKAQPPAVHQFDTEKLWHQLVVTEDIDMVETDHAPHDYWKKMEAEEQGGDVWGMPDEFAQRLFLRQLKLGSLSRMRYKQILTYNPARLLGVTINEKKTKVKWELRDYRLDNEYKYVKSKCGWTPYLGMMICGSVVDMTIGGRPVIVNGQLKDPAPGFISERGVEI